MFHAWISTKMTFVFSNYKLGSKLLHMNDVYWMTLFIVCFIADTLVHRLTENSVGKMLWWLSLKTLSLLKGNMTMLFLALVLYKVFFLMFSGLRTILEMWGENVCFRNSDFNKPQLYIYMIIYYKVCKTCLLNILKCNRNYSHSSIFKTLLIHWCTSIARHVNNKKASQWHY